jgi:phosphatidylserine decarboxylase
VLDSIVGIIPPIHREGYRFIAIFAALAVVLYWVSATLGVIGIGLTIWCAMFFRDPPRTTPQEEGLVISPADGRISMITELTPPAELDLGPDEVVRISVFMNVFDCHINRAPVAGTIVRTHYIPGKFLNAELDKASEDNERRLMTVQTGAGIRIGVMQIAGLVARRIVPFTDKGDRLEAGQRFGMIRFGSRVDVYLPRETSVLVAVGQRAVAGETVLADLNSRKPPRKAVTA